MYVDPILEGPPLYSLTNEGLRLRIAAFLSLGQLGRLRGRAELRRKALDHAWKLRAELYLRTFDQSRG